MEIEFIKASEDDAEKFVEVQNKSFYSDYLKYGMCPGYGRNAKEIIEAMKNDFVFKIVADKEVVGKISVKQIKDDEYHVNCLCIIPEYENKRIGQKAIAFIEKQYPHAKKWSLETPADKLRNHYFYKKCGYKIVDKMIDGTVELVVFEKEIS